MNAARWGWKLFRLALLYAALVAIGGALEFGALTLTPRSWWFTVYQVEAIYPALTGRPLTFVANIEHRRQSNVRAQVVLYCDFRDGAGFRFYSDQLFRIDDYPVRAKELGTLFNYTEAVPQVPAECYLRIVRGVRLHWGIWKRQTIESLRFELTEA